MGLTLGKGKTSGNSKARLIGFTRQVETVYSHSSYITQPPRSIFMSNFDEIVGKVKKEVGDTIGSGKMQAEGLIQKRVEEVATQMGLIEQLNLRPESLSGGQIQRLAIATAIVANPAVLIMDDPTSEMDPLGRRQFFQWLAQVKETTVFIVTSEIDDLCEVADVVWVLHEGQMVAQGRPSEVFNHLAADWQIPAPTIQQLAQKMDWHLADGRYPVNYADLKEVRYVHN